MGAAHLRDPETRRRATEARAALAASTPATTRPGSETTDLRVGDRVRVVLPGGGSGVSRSQDRRTGFVASVNTQTFPNGTTYTEVGLTWTPHKDWVKASADMWFRADEVQPA